ncbi:COP9 signalosome complex subunit 1, partial [Cladochytrium tenue]
FALRQPSAKLLGRRNELRPFDDPRPLEFLAAKNDAALVVLASHSRKRPHALTLARTFDHQLLDLVELHVRRALPAAAFGAGEGAPPRPVLGLRPALLFQGDRFDTDPLYARVRNLLMDLFRASDASTAVDLRGGLGHVISVAVDSDGVLHLRTYAVTLLRSGSRLPRVELTDCGPSVELSVGRHRLADDDLFKKATKRAPQLQVKGPLVAIIGYEISLLALERIVAASRKSATSASAETRMSRILEFRALRNFVVESPVINAGLACGGESESVYLSNDVLEEPSKAWAFRTTSAFVGALICDDIGCAFEVKRPVCYKEFLSRFHDCFIWLMQTVRDESDQIISTLAKSFEALHPYLEDPALDSIAESAVNHPEFASPSLQPFFIRILSFALEPSKRFTGETSGQARHLDVDSFRRICSLGGTSEALSCVIESAVSSWGVPPALLQSTQPSHSRSFLRVKLKNADRPLPGLFSLVDDSIVASTAALGLSNAPAGSLFADGVLLAASPVHFRASLQRGGVVSVPLLFGALANDAEDVLGAAPAETAQVVQAMLRRMTERVSGRGGDVGVEAGVAMLAEAACLGFLAGHPQFVSLTSEAARNLARAICEEGVGDALAACEWVHIYWRAITVSFGALAPPGQPSLCPELARAALKIAAAYMKQRKRFDPSEQSPPNSEERFGRLLTFTGRLLESVTLSAPSFLQFLDAFSGIGEIKEFVIACLKYRFLDPRVTAFLASFVQKAYTVATKRMSDIFSVSELLDLLLSHSQFKAVLQPPALSPEDPEQLPEAQSAQSSERSGARDSAAELVLTLVELDPARVYRSDLVGELVQALGGTAGRADCAILSTLRAFERHAGISVLAAVMQWRGAAAVAEPRPTAAAAAGASGGVAPALAAEALAALDQAVASSTLLRYPRPPAATAVSAAAVNVGDTRVVDGRAYAPGFVLSLVGAAVAYGAGRVEPRLLVESGGLPVAVMALASEDVEERRAAHFVLASAHDYFTEKTQLMLVLDALRNSLEADESAEVPARIPALMCLFIAKALGVMLHPESFMFPLINRHWVKSLRRMQDSNWDSVRPVLQVFLSIATSILRDALRLAEVRSANLVATDHPAEIAVLLLVSGTMLRDVLCAASNLTEPISPPSPIFRLLWRATSVISSFVAPGAIKSETSSDLWAVLEPDDLFLRANSDRASFTSKTLRHLSRAVAEATILLRVRTPSSHGGTADTASHNDNLAQLVGWVLGQFDTDADLWTRSLVSPTGGRGSPIVLRMLRFVEGLPQEWIQGFGCRPELISFLSLAARHRTWWCLAGQRPDLPEEASLSEAEELECDFLAAKVLLRVSVRRVEDAWGRLLQWGARELDGLELANWAALPRRLREAVLVAAGVAPVVGDLCSPSSARVTVYSAALLEAYAGSLDDSGLQEAARLFREAVAASPEEDVTMAGEVLQFVLMAAAAAAAAAAASAPSASTAPLAAALRDHARRQLVAVLDSVRGKKALVIDPALSGPLSLFAEYSLLKSVLEEMNVYGDVTVSEFHLDLLPLDDDVWSLELDDAFRGLFLDEDTSTVYYVAKAMMKLQSMFGVIPTIIGKGHCAKLLCDLMVRMKRELAMNLEEASGTADQIFPARSEFDSVIVLDRTVDLISPMCTQLTYEGLIDEIYGIRSTFAELDSTIVGPAPNAAAGASRTRKVPLSSADRLYSQLRNLNFAVVGSSRNQARTVSQLKDFIGKLGGIEAERASLKLHLVAGTIIASYMDYVEELIDKQAPLNHVLRLLCLYSLTNGGMKQKNYDHFRRELVQTYGVEHVLTLQNLHKLGLFRPSDPTKTSYPQMRRLLRLVVDDVDEQRPNDISYVYSGFAPVLVRLVQAASLRTTAPMAPTGAASPATATVSGIGGAVSPSLGGNLTLSGNLPSSPAIASRSSLLIGTIAGSLLGGPSSSSSAAAQSASTSSSVAASNGSLHAGAPSWKGWDEALKSLPGEAAFEDSQKAPDEGLLAKRNPATSKTTLVVFLGGCTSCEVSALRFLSRKDEGRQFVVVTTGMVNGNTLLSAVQGKLDVTSLRADDGRYILQDLRGGGGGGGNDEVRESHGGGRHAPYNAPHSARPLESSRLALILIYHSVPHSLSVLSRWGLLDSGGTRSRRFQVVTDPSIDLDVYIANYAGYGKVTRLEFIAQVCPQLREDACRAALVEIKQWLNVPRYLAVLELLNEDLKSRGLPETPADTAWVENVQRTVRSKTERLEAELRNYKTNLIKESIRMGHQDLGDHYFSIGDYTKALSCYSRTRDYCTTSKHIVDMCMNVIKVSLETQSHANARSYISKAEAVPDIPDRAATLSKLKACSGILNLAAGRYKAAARSFLDVSFQMGAGFAEVLSANDVATYGGLCALASFDRAELKAKVFDNAEFKQYLELEPQTREVLELFYGSKYGQCLALLTKLRSDLLLDLHLHDHVDSIYTSIRRKALVQYFSPFVSVDLNKMANTFNMDVASLEAELASLIVQNLIAARIDSHNK